jgi:hypothetical protein
MQRREINITHKQNNFAIKVKGTWVESLLSLQSLKTCVRIPQSPFSVSRRICVFLKPLSPLSKCRHVQSTNSNRPSYFHPNVLDSLVLHLSYPGGTFHLAPHLRLLNSEGSNQGVTLRNWSFRLILQPRSLNCPTCFLQFLCIEGPWCCQEISSQLLWMRPIMHLPQFRSSYQWNYRPSSACESVVHKIFLLWFYEGHLESKERSRIQPAQLFQCSLWVMWCVQ